MKNEKLKIKKLLITFLVLLVSIPLFVQAVVLVPCGGEGDACTLCDFFQLFKNIIDFLLLPPAGIVPIIATLMLVIGGIMFFFAGGSPDSLQKAKRLITSVVIGLIIVYGAWIFINTFFMLIGVADWTGLTEGWWSIDCQ